MTPAHVVDGEAEAIEISERWATSYEGVPSASPTAADLEAFSQSGLQSLNVPRAFGGPGLAFAAITRVLSIVAAGNAAIAHVAGRHLCTVDLLRSTSDDTSSQALLGLALRGRRFARANRDADDGAPVRLARSAEGHVLTGRSSADAADRFADFIPIRAVDDKNRSMLAFADRTAPGLRFTEPESGEANKAENGIFQFDSVKVSADHVVMLQPTSGRQHVLGSMAGAISAAIDLGIVHRAVESEIATLRREARPMPGKDDDARAEDPFAIREAAELKVRIHAADAVLSRAAGIIDAAFLDESLAVDAAIALAEAITLVAEAASRFDATWFDGGVIVPSSRAAIRRGLFAIGDYVVNGKAPAGQIYVRARA